MDSFVSMVTPFAIALVGFVILWGICRMVLKREEPDNSRDIDPPDRPKVDP